MLLRENDLSSGARWPVRPSYEPFRDFRCVDFPQDQVESERGSRHRCCCRSNQINGSFHIERPDRQSSEKTRAVETGRAARLGALSSRQSDRLACLSIVRHRTAPAGEIIGLRTLGHCQRLIQGMIEIALHYFSLESPAKKIRPEKLAERRRVFGEAAGPP